MRQAGIYIYIYIYKSYPDDLELRRDPAVVHVAFAKNNLRREDTSFAHPQVIMAGQRDNVVCLSITTMRARA